MSIPKQIKNPDWVTKKNGDEQNASEFNAVVEAIKNNAEVQKKQLRFDVKQGFTEAEKKIGRENLGIIETDLSDYYNKQEVDGYLDDKEEVSNKKTAIETNKTSNVFYPSIKAIYDWAVGKFLNLRLSNLAADLNETEQDEIKTKIGINDFTTQEITSGGNYNNLEVTADLLVFTNENAQAILNGVWGKKEFHILNLSETYEVQINHDSSSVSGSGLPIKLPTEEGSVGVKGTARILFNEDYGYFVADTWGSTYRPEFKGQTEPKVVVVNEESNAELRDIIEFRVFRDAQVTEMSKADLNAAYPEAFRGFEVVCKEINKTYLKVDNNSNDWVGITLNAVL